MKSQHLLLTILFIIAALSTGAQTQIQLGSASGAPEDTVNLPVTLTTGGNTVCALSLEIRYDESKLTPSAAELDSQGTAAGKQITQSYPLPGVLRLGLYGMNQTALANGVVANAKFTIREDAVGSSLLATTCGASDCSGNGVSAASGTATVSISSSTGNVHPADLDDDWKMEISEVTSYGSAWKSGATWERPPNPIPINYITKAGSLWKSGENYHYDAGADPPWTSGSSRRAEKSEAALTGTAQRKILSNERGFLVGIRVVPQTGVSAYAVEEILPPGCVPTDIQGEGLYDAGSHTIRWGPYMDDQARNLTYAVTNSMYISADSIHGIASFDGVGVAVAGPPGPSPGFSPGF